MGGINLMKIHIVQKGDTLWKISKKYGVNFEELKTINQQLVNHDMIMPGMKINIPSSSITKPQKQAKKEFPVKKEMPVQVKEEPIKKKTKEVKQPEVTKPLVPPAIPAPMPPPKPELQPSYQMQQAKMNVNFYHQPSYHKTQPKPAPKKVVKEKPIQKPLPPKPKPVEMVKPKPVDKIPEKKMPPPKPVKKMPPPKPIEKMPPPKQIKKKPMPMPMPMTHLPHAPVYQQVGPIVEGCIPLSALCGYGCQQPYQNGMVYPQTHGMYQQHHPFHSHMNHTQPYYPEPIHYSQQYPHWQNYQRLSELEEKEKEGEFRNTTHGDTYGDLTINNTQKKGNSEYASQLGFENYYDGMVPWTYPVRSFEDENDITNENK